MTDVGNSPSNAVTVKKIHAHPTKDFFVDMITRDISLKGCIFDLLDNSIDGARRERGEAADLSLAPHFARINFSTTEFQITDNCGGIRLSDAIDYAFHFGRRPNSPADVSGGIGLYGIGMKRAIFKLGRMTTVRSETADSCFTVNVDVEKWKQDEKDWDFDYDDAPQIGEHGTTFVVTQLHEGIAETFRDPEFRNSLVRSIAQDYSYFISKGFRIVVDGALVPSYAYQLKESSEIAPAVEAYEDEGVRIRLAAGWIDDLPDEIPEDLRPKDVDRYGWFVICNGRVVLAADKSHRTIWGADDYQVWHPQYNGFAGFAFFEADDQRKLPWTTTKRDLDESHPLYRRAVARMKRITDEFIDYSNRRKTDLDKAKAIEKSAAKVDVATLIQPQIARLPVLADGGYRKSFTTISYRKPLADLNKIRSHIGRPMAHAKDIGLLTFDYYWKSEIGK
jgi:hypothetical protein